MAAHTRVVDRCRDDVEFLVLIMKTVAQCVGWLAGLVLLATVFSSPYFRPATPWPDWLCLLVTLGAIIAVLAYVQKPNAAQRVLEYRQLSQQIETLERHLEIGKRERWEPSAIASVREKLAKLQQQRKELEIP